MPGKPAPPAPRPPAPPKPPAPVAPKVDVVKPPAPKVDPVKPAPVVPQAPAGQPIVSVPTKKPHKKKHDDLDGLDVAWILLGILLLVVIVAWIFSRD